MYSKFSNWKNERDSGMVLVMALLLMAVAALIIIPGLWATTTMLTVNLDSLNRTNAYYAAKAGIVDVYWRFKQSGGTPPGFPYVLPGSPLNGMTVTVGIIPGTTVETAGTLTTYPLQSTASLSGTTLSTIYSRITVESTPGYPFYYAMATTGGGITVASNSYVTSKPVDYMADIYAQGGALNISGSVHGTAYYVPPQTNTGCNNVSGGCSTAPAVTFQSLDESWYLQQAQLGIYWPSTPAPAGWPNMTLPLPTPYGTGTYTITGTQTLGGPGYITYIDGNLTIGNKGDVTLSGVVWVNGNIYIDGGTINTSAIPSQQSYLLAHGEAADAHYILVKSNSRINSYGNLNFISDNGTVTLESNIKGSPRVGIIYAPNGAVTINSNSDITIAAVLGKSINLNSNVTIDYNTALRDNPPQGFTFSVSNVQLANYSGQ